jgi:hypothetical protein
MTLLFFICMLDYSAMENNRVMSSKSHLNSWLIVNITLY